MSADPADELVLVHDRRLVGSTAGRSRRIGERSGSPRGALVCDKLRQSGDRGRLFDGRSAGVDQGLREESTRRGR